MLVERSNPCTVTSSESRRPAHLEPCEGDRWYKIPRNIPGIPKTWYTCSTRDACHLTLISEEPASWDLTTELALPGCRGGSEMNTWWLVRQQGSLDTFFWQHWKTQNWILKMCDTWTRADCMVRAMKTLAIYISKSVPSRTESNRRHARMS